MLKNKIIVFFSLISIVSFSFVSLIKCSDFLYTELDKQKFEKEHPIEMELNSVIANNDMKRFNELLLQVSDINIKDFIGRTFLITAANWGCVDMVKILLGQSNIKVDEQDKYGDTALIRVIDGIMGTQLNKEEIIKSLLAAGANPNIKNNRGETFYTLQERYNKELCYSQRMSVRDASRDTSFTRQMLFEKEHPLELELFRIISNNDMKRFNELLPQVGDINIKDWNGCTFLITAANWGRVDMVKILLKQSNIKIDEQNRYRETALVRGARSHIGTKIDKEEIIKSLLTAGADPDIEDRDGETFHDLYQIDGCI